MEQTSRWKDRIISDLKHKLENPEERYWFARSDGKLRKKDDEIKRHIFHDEEYYLTNRIPPVPKPLLRAKPDYFNAEIYNDSNILQGPITPWNLVPNRHLVDNPLDPNEWGNYIRDTVLNVPFEVGNGLSMYCSVRAETLPYGSRGWGFWNTTTSLRENNTAWFIHLAGDTDYQLNGFWAVTQNGLNMSMHPLDALDENEHDYEIILEKNAAEFYIDKKLVHREDNKFSIPTLPMAFHNWVDNAVFTLGLFGIKHVTFPTAGIRTNYTKDVVLQWE